MWRRSGSHTALFIRMPHNAHVFLNFGPYNSFGEVKHRTDRLDGLRDVLTTNGHTVELMEIMDREAVELWVKGQKVFTCNITDLDYGGDGKLDELCAKALEQVNHAF